MIALLTGRENDEDINKIPYHKIILKCTQIDASRRYGSVSKLKKSLQSCSIILRIVIIIMFVILILSVIFYLSDASNKNSNNKTQASTSAQAQKKDTSDVVRIESLGGRPPYCKPRSF